MTSPKNLSELYSHFNEFRLQKKFYDVIVKVGDSSFPGHRIILSSALQCFRNMTDSVNEVELKDVSPVDFELVLTHVYGGPVSFDENNICRLLKLSRQLCLRSLEDLCIDYLANRGGQLSLSTAINVFEYACSIGNRHVLVEMFSKCFAKNFSRISKYETFARISGTALSQILVHVNSSDSALDFLKEWVKFQPEDGKKCLPDLLKAVNLEEVSNKWFLDTIMRLNDPTPSNVVFGSRNKTDDSKKVLLGNSNGSKKEDGKKSSNLGPKMDEDGRSFNRGEMHLPFVLYTLDIQYQPMSYTKCLNMYKFENCQNVQLMNSTHYKIKYQNNAISTNIDCCKSVVVKNVQFMIIADTYFDMGVEYYRYLPYVCRQFSLHQELPKYNSKSYRNAYNCKHGLSVTACDDHIYVYHDQKFRRFDCQTNTWHQVCLIDQEGGSYCPSLVSSNNSLYLIGSNTNGKSFQRYDMREGKWTQLPKMIGERSHSASCIHNDTLYVSGGFDTWCENTIECYSFRTNKWRAFQTMPENKMNHIFLTYNNKLWFFGGQVYDSSYAETLTWYSYDLKEHKWSDIFSVPATCGANTIHKIFDVVVNV